MRMTGKHAKNISSVSSTRIVVEVQAALARKSRKRRIALFTSLASSLTRPLQVLDVGGTQGFWELMGLITDDVRITVYNLSSEEVAYPTLASMSGDARNMQEFKDKQFQIVFSNSVIEHVGTYAQQRQMAEEVQRVGERYYVQTPNRYFPIEPHFLFPFFQFLPVRLRVFLVTHFNLGWRGNISDKHEAVKAVKEIRLLTEKELKKLFPGAQIYKEKLLGLTKSFTVYKGWESQQGM